MKMRLGKLDGKAARGDCPVGDVLVNGSRIGEWGPDTAHDSPSAGSSDPYLVYGYFASISVDGREVSISVEREGVTHAGFVNTYVRFSPGTESAASAKRRLKQRIVKAVGF